MRLIAVTGGIGSGKSVVCRMLSAMGYEVYDCDSRAKSIMDGSKRIKRVISEEICEEALVDGEIDRKRLADAVFADEKLLEKLNAAVHYAVREDIAEWSKDRHTAFVETAILYQSGLDSMVSQVWNVTAPEPVRIERVMARNGFDRESVRQRILVQDGFVPDRIHPEVHEIVNDGLSPLLPRIEELLSRL